MPEITPARYRAGHGEPLVLVHGFTATWPCWRPVLADLVPRFDVFAPTLHGHDGGPPPPDGPAHTIAHAADHFESLLDEQGIETAHFAGNSMGGALALEMAKRGRARSVVAISPGGGWEADDTEEPERIIKWFARNRKLVIKTAKYTPRVMKRPFSRRLALRDVMTRGDQVPVQEAIELARSSANCTVVDDVFETIRSGSARVRRPRHDHLPGARRVGRQGPHPADGPPRRPVPPRDPERRVPRAAGLGHTPMWDDPGLIARLIGDYAAAAQARTVQEAAAAG